ncbi:DNA-binding protein [Archaeoglobus veneficus]|uniref:PilT protein domain protein n=1 Tax=Archaeoglobus veneficus (strain DSM 11195 / SNP6) TaxID=693661 RepID=F2KPF2_ARCVS|nr:DNA-binding protein [Archaeoglobus veneficus]AEA46383.1 PilT protein domain protein [Archaeoglobus veneficus SNP6]
MVLVDNTVLSNFAKVNRLDLLRRTLEKVYVTEQVLEEFKFGAMRGVLPVVSPDFEVLKLEGEEIELYNSLRVKLGKGEASCLAIAKNRNMKFLTDDSDARKVANILGVPVSGIVGVLVRCIEKSVISKEEGNQILKEMIAKGFYSPISDLEEIG